ncbi:hypothetical protein HELRODRAFT_192216 [Helobdella robusta]|uniref:Ig-like domain-containing protein n=1 Tax=Helobdella robusta TaxID=6412 RepID=T1FTQ0_HELRO|nr:hypothetical protein HELRODRAFT_192216 [Helobdella robusta]ESO01633.1 hypothetical protein HELRODRAFT_192216 [Helobdella robusta]
MSNSMKVLRFLILFLISRHGGVFTDFYQYSQYVKILGKNESVKFEKFEGCSERESQLNFLEGLFQNQRYLRCIGNYTNTGPFIRIGTIFMPISFTIGGHLNSSRIFIFLRKNVIGVYNYQIDRRANQIYFCVRARYLLRLSYYTFVWEIDAGFFRENITLLQSFSDMYPDETGVSVDKISVQVNESVTCLYETDRGKSLYEWDCVKDDDKEVEEAGDEDDFYVIRASIYFQTNGTYNCMCTVSNYISLDKIGSWRGDIYVSNKKAVTWARSGSTRNGKYLLIKFVVGLLLAAKFSLKKVRSGSGSDNIEIIDKEGIFFFEEVDGCPKYGWHKVGDGKRQRPKNPLTEDDVGLFVNECTDGRTKYKLLILQDVTPYCNTSRFSFQLLLKSGDAILTSSRLVLYNGDQFVKVVDQHRIQNGYEFCVDPYNIFNFVGARDTKYVWEVDAGYFKDNITLFQYYRDSYDKNLKADKNSVAVNETVTCTSVTKLRRKGFIWHCIKITDDENDESNYVINGSSIYFKTKGTYNCICTLSYISKYFGQDTWQGNITVINKKVFEMETMEKSSTSRKKSVFIGVMVGTMALLIIAFTLMMFFKIRNHILRRNQQERVETKRRSIKILNQFVS